MSLISFLAAKFTEIFGPLSGSPLKSKGFKIQIHKNLNLFIDCFLSCFVARKWVQNPYSMKVQSMMVILKKSLGL